MSTTNGGKPHVCGEIAVHNTGVNEMLYVCGKCNMPVDKPNPTPSWSERLEAQGFLVDACEACDGLGKEPNMLSTDPWKLCDRCKGTGNESDEYNRLIAFIDQVAKEERLKANAELYKQGKFDEYMRIVSILEGKRVEVKHNEECLANEQPTYCDCGWFETSKAHNQALDSAIQAIKE